MELVINIPDLDWSKVQNGSIATKHLLNAVKCGIPLSKGHGRIIDETKISKCEQVGLIMKDGNVTRCLTTDAPTIVEADNIKENK